MRFDTKPHPLYCGIDRQARTMSVCILNQDGESLLHRNRSASPEPFLRAIAPSQPDLVVCVEGLFTWYGLADLGAREGGPCVLGHALSRKAIHGGQINHDTLDAHNIAGLRRGGRLPQASGYPTARRATRALLRRRLPLTRKRAELLTHVQQTNWPYNLPELGQQIADKAPRHGGAARVPDPAVQKSVEVDLALIDSYAQLLRDVDLTSAQTAMPHDAQTLYRLQSVPGIGKILSLVRLDEMHDIPRFPRVQDFVSYCRLVKGGRESAGKRYGTAGTKMGHASLTWAFSEAAV